MSAAALVNTVLPLAADWVGWRWPVLPWNGRKPVISHEYEAGNRYLPNGELNYAVHLGLDLMFPRYADDPIGPADTVSVSKRFIAPVGAVVVAAGPGKIWSTQQTKLGLSIVIDHGHVSDHAGGVNTFYQHLCEYAKPWHHGDIVQAGDVLGVMGGDPANAPHLRHLHFELWFPRAGVQQMLWPTDPAPYMQHWAR